jgi:hypothetical protein
MWENRKSGSKRECWQVFLFHWIRSRRVRRGVNEIPIWRGLGYQHSTLHEKVVLKGVFGVSY